MGLTSLSAALLTGIDQGQTLKFRSKSCAQTVDPLRQFDPTTNGITNIHGNHDFVPGVAEISVQPYVIEAMANHICGYKSGVAGIDYATSNAIPPDEMVRLTLSWLVKSQVPSPELT